MKCPVCGGEIIVYQQFGARCSRDPGHDLAQNQPPPVFLRVTVPNEPNSLLSIPYVGVRYFKRHRDGSLIVWYDEAKMLVNQTIEQLEAQILEAE